MQEQQRVQMICALEGLDHRVVEIRQEMQLLVDEHNLKRDPDLQAMIQAADALAQSIQSNTETLKKGGSHRITDFVKQWHVDRLDHGEPEGLEIKDIKHIKGEIWEAEVCSAARGREKMTVKSDTAGWTDMFDCVSL